VVKSCVRDNGMAVWCSKCTSHCKLTISDFGTRWRRCFCHAERCEGHVSLWSLVRCPSQTRGCQPTKMPLQVVTYCIRRDISNVSKSNGKDFSHIVSVFLITGDTMLFFPQTDRFHKMSVVCFGQNNTEIQHHTSLFHHDLTVSERRSILQLGTTMQL